MSYGIRQSAHAAITEGDQALFFCWPSSYPLTAHSVTAPRLRLTCPLDFLTSAVIATHAHRPHYSVSDEASEQLLGGTLVTSANAWDEVILLHYWYCDVMIRAHRSIRRSRQSTLVDPTPLPAAALGFKVPAGLDGVIVGRHCFQTLYHDFSTVQS